MRGNEIINGQAIRCYFNPGAGGVTSVVYIDQPERDAQMDDANRREDERERQDGIGGD